MLETVLRGRAQSMKTRMCVGCRECEWIDWYVLVNSEARTDDPRSPWEQCELWSWCMIFLSRPGQGSTINHVLCSLPQTRPYINERKSTGPEVGVRAQACGWGFTGNEWWSPPVILNDVTFTFHYLVDDRWHHVWDVVYSHVSNCSYVLSPRYVCSCIVQGGLLRSVLACLGFGLDGFGSRLLRVRELPPGGGFSKGYPWPRI